jgi:hypothetical protein
VRVTPEAAWTTRLLQRRAGLGRGSSRRIGAVKLSAAPTLAVWESPASELRLSPRGLTAGSLAPLNFSLRLPREKV